MLFARGLDTNLEIAGFHLAGCPRDGSRFRVKHESGRQRSGNDGELIGPLSTRGAQRSEVACAADGLAEVRRNLDFVLGAAGRLILALAQCLTAGHPAGLGCGQGQ